MQNLIINTMHSEAVLMPYFALKLQKLIYLFFTYTYTNISIFPEPQENLQSGSF